MCSPIKLPIENLFVRTYHCTEKHIFFFQTSWKDGLSKKLCWNMISLVLSEKIIFLFPENMISYPRRKMKDDLSQKKNKKTRKYDIFFKLSEKMVFLKRVAPAHDLSCIVWKYGIFFPKTWYFFPGQKVRGGLSQEIHGNITFSVYTYGCYKRGAPPLCQKQIKDGFIPQKYT